ncbi:hypothetical protein ACFW1A_11955 [Kitasatospora sp. NPDC058965]|uniref:hypothetical protein n=1 Tax=Kitasatospora sp. NPDC058965 TaxID=3346682 RepID=UPI0036B093DD
MTDQPTPAPPAETEQQPAEQPEQQPARPAPAAKLVFADPLGRQTSDDTDAAWGESSSARGLDWYLEQRPPHHG